MAKDSTLAITGARVHSYGVRTVKDVEKLRVVLEIDCDDITADMGEVQKALYIHKKSDTEVGLNVLVRGGNQESVSVEDDDFDV